MDERFLSAALELTAAMTAAADAGAWDTTAELARQRHVCLETALAGDAWRLRPPVIEALRSMLAADRTLTDRAARARQETAAALQELRGGHRMHGAYAAQAAAG
ncbi:MAG: flagellar protein FliT [Gammaproteobacteria bacterium]